jgi:hypothetical protein
MWACLMGWQVAHANRQVLQSLSLELGSSSIPVMALVSTRRCVLATEMCPKQWCSSITVRSSTECAESSECVTWWRDVLCPRVVVHALKQGGSKVQPCLLRFYSLALNAPGSPPGPSAPAVAAAAATTVTPAVAALVRAHFRQSHQIHWTGGLHRH